jgi:branched-chain amino acid transport system permease protein
LGGADYYPDVFRCARYVDRALDPAADDRRAGHFGDHGDAWFIQRVEGRRARYLGHRYPAVPGNFSVDAGADRAVAGVARLSYSVGCVAILLLLFTLFFKYSRAGIAMRATAFSQQVAMSMGISVRRMFALAWAIAAVVSAIGGILLGGVRGGVDAALAAIGLKVIPVVILGGLDSIIGAIVGGLIVGVLENLAGGYLDPLFGGGVKEVAPFVILVLILMVKPYGLFGKVHIDRV